eukprot:TRINITY_DN15456_c0_g1_i1.p1 TRINITY_DN15456_c0_g1~~TRINITY_DN15456_c0_g1_i1.p1  ORF type:complete len:540 (-),score=90.86 TRINITY_DN15456_c0_g1_i1:43-1614(-)
MVAPRGANAEMFSFIPEKEPPTSRLFAGHNDSHGILGKSWNAHYADSGEKEKTQDEGEIRRGHFAAGSRDNRRTNYQGVNDRRGFEGCRGKGNRHYDQSVGGCNGGHDFSYGSTYGCYGGVAHVGFGNASYHPTSHNRINGCSWAAWVPAHNFGVSGNCRNNRGTGFQGTSYSGAPSRGHYVRHAPPKRPAPTIVKPSWDYDQKVLEREYGGDIKQRRAQERQAALEARQTCIKGDHLADLLDDCGRTDLFDELARRAKARGKGSPENTPEIGSGVAKAVGYVPQPRPMFQEHEEGEEEEDAALCCKEDADLPPELCSGPLPSDDYEASLARRIYTPEEKERRAAERRAEAAASQSRWGSSTAASVASDDIKDFTVAATNASDFEVGAGRTDATIASDALNDSAVDRTTVPQFEGAIASTAAVSATAATEDGVDANSREQAGEGSLGSEGLAARLEIVTEAFDWTRFGPEYVLLCVGDYIISQGLEADGWKYGSVVDPSAGYRELRKGWYPTEFAQPSNSIEN